MYLFACQMELIEESQGGCLPTFEAGIRPPCRVDLMDDFLRLLNGIGSAKNVVDIASFS